MNRNAARASNACISCHRRKRKCNGGQPCAVCMSRGITCIYDPHADKRRSLAKQHLKKLRTEQEEPWAPESSLADDAIMSHRTEPLLIAEASIFGEASVSSPPNAFTQTNLQTSPPGSLAFGLKLGRNGELEYRGPTSSVTGDRLPTASTDTGESFEPVLDAEAPSLPSAEEMRTHVELFVEWQNASILILPGGIIEHLLLQCPSSDDSSSTQAVLWSILSLTYKMIYTNRLSYIERCHLSDQAFEVASRLVFSLCHRKPNVDIVQAACILACREYSCGHENGAWVFHGISCTVGGSIGLQAGKDYDKWIESGHLSPQKAEARVIAYWAIILADRMFASCLGRNCLLHPTDFGTPEIRLRVLAIASTSDDRALVEGSSSYVDSVLNTFRCAVDLWKMCDEVYTAIYIWQHDLSTILASPVKLLPVLHKLSDAVQRGTTKIRNWYDTLPQLLSIDTHGPLPHLLLINMAYQNFHILSHRPLLLLQSESFQARSANSMLFDAHSDASSVCRAAAQEMLRLCQTYQEHYTLQWVPFIIAHYLTNAYTIFLLYLDSKDPSSSGQAKQGMSTCRSLLREMAAVWEVATNALALIDDLRHKKEAWSADQRVTESTPNLPLSVLGTTATGSEPSDRNALSDHLSLDFDFWDFNFMAANRGPHHEFL